MQVLRFHIRSDQVLLKIWQLLLSFSFHVILTVASNCTCIFCLSAMAKEVCIEQRTYWKLPALALKERVPLAHLMGCIKDFKTTDSKAYPRWCLEWSIYSSHVTKQELVECNCKKTGNLWTSRNNSQVALSNSEDLINVTIYRASGCLIHIPRSLTIIPFTRASNVPCENILFTHKESLQIIHLNDHILQWCKSRLSALMSTDWFRI